MGQPAPGTTSFQALVRLAAGMTQTGNNVSDFALATPNPRNSSSAQNPICLQTPARPASWGNVKVLYR
jgi:hypothetical protein